MAATVGPFRGRGEMPRPRVAMRRIKEVLRLKEGLGLSDTAVSRSVRIARSTVKEYLDRAAAAGLNWETVAELSEEELDRRLFAAVDTRQCPLGGCAVTRRRFPVGARPTRRHRSSRKQPEQAWRRRNV